jgi:hypothetical protein
VQDWVVHASRASGFGVPQKQSFSSGDIGECLALGCPEVYHRKSLQWRGHHCQTRETRVLPILKLFKRRHQITRQRANAIENAIGQWFRSGISGSEHFQARVEIVDVMEDHRFRSFRADRRPKLVFAMMCANEMEKMDAHIF